MTHRAGQKGAAADAAMEAATLAADKNALEGIERRVAA
jgi:hypothetical protein